MDTKGTRRGGKNRTNGDTKSSSKTPVKAKLGINQPASKSAREPKRWKIKITILDAYGVELAAMIVKPKPPTPPIVPTEFVKLIGGLAKTLIRVV